MKNFFLITSVINISNNPLSYTNIRSVFNSNERFEQTKNTINTIRNKVPNVSIMIVETSLLNKEHEEYLKNNCDYFLNFYDDLNVRARVNSSSKSMGEGTQIIKALEYIKNNNICFDNFFKITGRYWLGDKFNYSIYDNNSVIYRGYHKAIITSLYKINYENIDFFYKSLINSEEDFKNCRGQEEIFFDIFSNISNKIHVDIIGIEGFISVTGDLFHEN